MKLREGLRKFEEGHFMGMNYGEHITSQRQRTPDEESPPTNDTELRSVILPCPPARPPAARPLAPRSLPPAVLQRRQGKGGIHD